MILTTCAYTVVKVAQLSPTLCDPMEFSRQNPGVGSLSLLQGIFPTQGSNPGLLHCRQILYQLSYQGSPNLSLTSAKVINDTTSALEAQQTSLTNLA